MGDSRRRRSTCLELKHDSPLLTQEEIVRPHAAGVDPPRPGGTQYVEALRATPSQCRVLDDAQPHRRWLSGAARYSVTLFIFCMTVYASLGPRSNALQYLPVSLGRIRFIGRPCQNGACGGVHSISVVGWLALALAFAAFIAAVAFENSLQHWRACAQTVEPILARLLGKLPIQRLLHPQARPRYALTVLAAEAGRGSSLRDAPALQIVPPEVGLVLARSNDGGRNVAWTPMSDAAAIVSNGRVAISEIHEGQVEPVTVVQAPRKYRPNSRSGSGSIFRPKASRPLSRP